MLPAWSAKIRSRLASHSLVSDSNILAFQFSFSTRRDLMSLSNKLNSGWYRGEMPDGASGNGSCSGGGGWEGAFEAGFGKSCLVLQRLPINAYGVRQRGRQDFAQRL